MAKMVNEKPRPAVDTYSATVGHRFLRDPRVADLTLAEAGNFSAPGGPPLLDWWLDYQMYSRDADSQLIPRGKLSSRAGALGRSLPQIRPAEADAPDVNLTCYLGNAHAVTVKLERLIRVQSAFRKRRDQALNDNAHRCRYCGKQATCALIDDKASSKLVAACRTCNLERGGEADEGSTDVRLDTRRAATDHRRGGAVADVLQGGAHQARAGGPSGASAA